jgi:hypothetical protein
VNDRGFDLDELAGLLAVVIDDGDRDPEVIARAWQIMAVDLLPIMRRARPLGGPIIVRTPRHDVGIRIGSDGRPDIASRPAGWDHWNRRREP